MLNNRSFWYANIAGLGLIYLAAIVLVLQGQTSHWLVMLAAVIVIAHLLELPLAFNALKSLNPNPLRVVVMTVVVGLLWWVPAKRGLFAVR